MVECFNQDEPPDADEPPDTDEPSDLGGPLSCVLLETLMTRLCV